MLILTFIPTISVKYLTDNSRGVPLTDRFGPKVGRFYVLIPSENDVNGTLLVKINSFLGQRRQPRKFNFPHLKHLCLTSTFCNLFFSFQPSGVMGGLPQQIGNKTECALLGFVIDLGVDYRQVLCHITVLCLKSGKICFKGW